MGRDKPLLPCPNITDGQKELISEQEAYARQFAQERIAAMLFTAPIDEAEAEEHLRAAYRVAGLEPVPMRWFDSPLAFCNISFEDFLWKRLDEAVLFIERDSIEDSICSALLLNDGVPIGDSVVDIVQRSIHSVCDSIWSCAWGSVNDSVWKGVWADTLYNLLPNTVDSVWHYVDNSVRSYYHQGWQRLCQWVPPTIASADEAVAWTFGLDAQAY